MQSEQFASQPKRLRSEAKTFAEDSPNPLLAEEVIDGNSLNKRETIDNLISTLQRLRDEGDSLPPSTVDVLNSMARGYTVQPPTTSTAEILNHPPAETRVPALQAVPYIVPQQKLELSCWRDANLQGISVPYLFHQRQWCPSLAGTPQLDFVASAGSFSGVTPLSMYQLPSTALSGEKITNSQEFYGVGTEADMMTARLQYLQQQKQQKAKASYSSNQATAAQLSMPNPCLPASTTNFPAAQLFTAPAVARARKTEFTNPAEQVVIRKVSQYSHPQNHNRNTQSAAFNSPMLISKAQLLNNQHLEPLYDEKLDNNNTARCLLTQSTVHNKEKQENDPVVVDSSVRECNEWSIYTVSLPTRLHVKCNCFGPNA